MYLDQDFKKVEKCDMCECKKSNMMYISDLWGSDAVGSNVSDRKISVVKCENCGFVYSQEILSTTGSKKFWRNYSTNVHQSVQDEVNKRMKMYQLEYNFIQRFLDKESNNDILDVGCAEGGFLDFFSEKNNCYGIEVGKDALIKARKKYIVYEGNLPEIKIDKKFDLIIFRGVIQYFEQPKQYFNKAVDLLKPEGLIYITSTPNADSFVHHLFKEYFTLPVCAVACKGFSTSVLTNYFETKGLYLVGEKNFYEETPYANLYADLQKIMQALEMQKEGRKVNFKAPAFWGNMLTVVFKKRL